MISPLVRCCVRFAAFTLVIGSAASVWAAAPNPLENAYWRFEEGTAGNAVAPKDTDVVQDSANDNDMRTPSDANFDRAPSYITSVPPTPLKSGLANNLALEFDAASHQEVDVFATHNIANGTIAPGGGITIEAAFRPSIVTYPGGDYQAIISKDREPANDNADPKTTIEKLPTLVLKIRGDNGLLQLEQFDGAKNLVSVSSAAPLNADEWFYAAAVNTGTELKLYLDRNDGNGYQLQSTTGVDGALYQGPNSSSPDWVGTWSVGRGNFDGPADWFNGIIDEVRISNTALDPSQFLFAPLDGDFDHNFVVDARDYVVWRKGLNTTYLPADYDVWCAHFGQPGGGAAGGGISGAAAVPEAASGAMVITAIVAICFRRRAVAR